MSLFKSFALALFYALLGSLLISASAGAGGCDAVYGCNNITADEQFQLDNCTKAKTSALNQCTSGGAASVESTGVQAVTGLGANDANGAATSQKEQSLTMAAGVFNIYDSCATVIKDCVKSCQVAIDQTSLQSGAIAQMKAAIQECQAKLASVKASANSNISTALTGFETATEVEGALKSTSSSATSTSSETMASTPATTSTSTSTSAVTTSSTSTSTPATTTLPKAKIVQQQQSSPVSKAMDQTAAAIANVYSSGTQARTPASGVANGCCALNDYLPGGACQPGSSYNQTLPRCP
jgi:hypothetical protein